MSLATGNVQVPCTRCRLRGERRGTSAANKEQYSSTSAFQRSIDYSSLDSAALPRATTWSFLHPPRKSGSLAISGPADRHWHPRTDVMTQPHPLQQMLSRKGSLFEMRLVCDGLSCRPIIVQQGASGRLIFADLTGVRLRHVAAVSCEARTAESPKPKNDSARAEAGIRRCDKGVVEHATTGTRGQTKLEGLSQRRLTGILLYLH